MIIQNINFNIFENKEPKQQWFNELNVNIAKGKWFEKKADFQKAANCYETVVYYNPKDIKTRCRLIECYRKVLQPKKAEIHKNYVMQSDPRLFQTIQNKENVELEIENFEYILMMHNQLDKKIKTSQNSSQKLSNVIIQKNIMIKIIVPMCTVN